MKCIQAIRETKTYKLGEIRRTDDQDADQKVASGTFKFIPKSEWKAQFRKVAPQVEEVAVAEPTIAEKQLKKKKSK